LQKYQDNDYFRNFAVIAAFARVMDGPLLVTFADTFSNFGKKLTQRLKQTSKSKMMPISSYVTPTLETRCTAMSHPPPPVPAKQQICLTSNKDDEGFKSIAPYFPSLIEESHICDNDTPSVVIKDSIEANKHAFSSPLSVEKRFVMPRIRLKPRFSPNEYGTYTMKCSQNTHEAEGRTFYY
jgi:hypothetical protein